MNPKAYDRLELNNFDTKLADEEAGVVTGNKMTYSVQLTDTIELVKTPISLWEVDWGWQFNDENLHRSNFGYRWQTKKDDFEEELSLGGMPRKWVVSGPRLKTNLPLPSEGIELGQAGINRPVTLYLSEGYAVPEQECWGFLGTGSCQVVAEQSTSHFDMGSGMIYDILPATLD